ncbi:murein biosynthesis integral membrane protein MurJ [bacterium (Candidatus Gribaldobacteria) CG_4_10_14_0_8_um_filter_33_9]|uniref:Probable lipid II flippase MurJ n=1 Tax=bacterium (Candidatus Gribaldobacteria) CG_4_10_14_0_8_um_filter_33_9 TaxID=2014266 RepID=A0A2M7RPW3_9BACT|nr:MAG: murein biosynthesis integral membrane protein MurJ [bacterium (Candidatus Gribaldobacteria) CG_4_10_14_0_8_um_filter_33_9]
MTITKILNSQTKTITFAAFLLFLSAFLSRLLGLLRDNLLANLFVKQETDIYFAAFLLPDFLYGILITGGIVAAFLPVFAENFKISHLQARALFNSIFTIFFIALILISLLLVIFAPQFVGIIAPGFSADQQALMVILTRIMCLSPVLLGVSSIFSSILQYFNLFWAVALAPLFYNFGIIFGILFLTPIFGLQGLGLGVILGAFLHLLIQIFPLSKIGFLPYFSFDFKPCFFSLKKFLKLMIPRTIGSIAYNLNLVIITAIASTLSAGAISVFNFSNNLQYIPVGLIGVSFATASFPLFSQIFIEKNKEKFSQIFFAIFSKILFLIIPLSVLIFLFRSQLVNLIFSASILEVSHFEQTQARLIAASLGVFSFSLFAACLMPFLIRVFFSIQNTKTPVKIALFTMLFNIILCYFFVWLLSFSNFFQSAIISFLHINNIKDISVIALPLALSFSAIFQFFLLILEIKKKLNFLKFSEIFSCFKKILIASLLMTVLCYFVLNVFVFTPFLQLILASLTALFSYFAFAHFLKLKETKIIFDFLKKFIK